MLWFVIWIKNKFIFVIFVNMVLKYEFFFGNFVFLIVGWKMRDCNRLWIGGFLICFFGGDVFCCVLEIWLWDFLFVLWFWFFCGGFCWLLWLFLDVFFVIGLLLLLELKFWKLKEGLWELIKVFFCFVVFLIICFWEFIIDDFFFLINWCFVLFLWKNVFVRFERKDNKMKD